MEAVAKCCQQCILESGRKPTNRDLKGIFWGRYDKYLSEIRHFSTLPLDRRNLGSFRSNSHGFDQFFEFTRLAVLSTGLRACLQLNSVQTLLCPARRRLVHSGTECRYVYCAGLLLGSCRNQLRLGCQRRPLSILVCRANQAELKTGAPSVAQAAQPGRSPPALPNYGGKRPLPRRAERGDPTARGMGSGGLTPNLVRDA